MKKIFISLLCISLLFSCASTSSNRQISNTAVFDDLWNEFNNQYAIFGVNSIDWDESYKTFRPMVNDELSEDEFYNIICSMLEPLNDSHVRVVTRNKQFISGGMGKSNFDLKIAKTYLTEVKSIGDDNIVYGKIGSKGYIYVKTFTSNEGFTSTILNWATEIDNIIDYLYDCDSIILDLRSNGGGLPQTALHIGSRFADQKRFYQYISNKTGPGKDDFSEKRGKYILPDGPKQYLKPVYMLTDNLSASATEDLVMALRSLPHVTHIGEGTRGIFSTHIGRDLLNGWRYTMSFQRITDENDICYEGVGMIPKEENLIIYNSEDRDKGIDTHIKYIIENLWPVIIKKI